MFVFCRRIACFAKESVGLNVRAAFTARLLQSDPSAAAAAATAAAAAAAAAAPRAHSVLKEKCCPAFGS